MQLQEEIQQRIDICKAEMKKLDEDYIAGKIRHEVWLNFISYNRAMIFAYEDVMTFSKYCS